ncbi:MAG: trypsin-like peptidase domain-containing protein [Saprospiraceae bacterium]|nr:trypsin-like peptidase domain-containing protein [Saprospiraceae bacterium]
MKTILQYVGIAVLSSVCTFFLCRSFYQFDNSARFDANLPVQLVNHGKNAPVNANPRDWSENVLPNFTTVAKQVTEAVVSISAFNATGYRMSSGSGVVISSDGYVITNHHVVEDGQKFEIVLQDKRTLVARVVGIDETTDLALLRVNFNGMKALPIGDSDRLEVGEWVLAVGNPFDLNSTITAGIVSAKARNINILKGQYSIESFIQTDAVVNPGNSGGALVNTRGELIGVNTAIISESGGYEGYSFAIPSNLVRKVVNDLREFGEVKRAVLGVNIADVNSRIAAELSLPSVEGVYVTNVNQGSSAFEAGLRAGDVIVSVNSAKVASMPELQEQVALFRPGDRVSLEYYRSGRKHRIDNVVLKSITDTASLRFR